MPAPGTLTRWSPPSGPGVRLDGGYEEGETIPGAFDSLIAKLIVSGRDRTQALERSRRALDEFVVDGMPTVIPFHAAVVSDPAFIGTPAENPESFEVYTQWIETDFDNQITPYAGDRPDAPEPDERNKVTVEVGGRRLEVVIPGGLAAVGGGAGGARKPSERVGRSTIVPTNRRRVSRAARRTLGRAWASRDDSPYDVASRPMARCWSPPAARARSSGSPATRCGRRSSRASTPSRRRCSSARRRAR